jgi:hypothetical protein
LPKATHKTLYGLGAGFGKEFVVPLFAAGQDITTHSIPALADHHPSDIFPGAQRQGQRPPVRTQKELAGTDTVEVTPFLFGVEHEVSVFNDSSSQARIPGEVILIHQVTHLGIFHRPLQKGAEYVFLPVHRSTPPVRKRKTRPPFSPRSSRVKTLRS